MQNNQTSNRSEVNKQKRLYWYLIRLLNSVPILDCSLIKYRVMCDVEYLIEIMYACNCEEFIRITISVKQ